MVLELKVLLIETVSWLWVFLSVFLWCCFTPLEFMLGGLVFWVGWPHIYGVSCILFDVPFRNVGAIVVYRF